MEKVIVRTTIFGLAIYMFIVFYSLGMGYW